MHYFEFVSVDDMDKPDNEKRFLQLHELEQGKRYITYVTTYAGLYRYNMNDMIEVGPKYWDTPSVYLIQKITHSSPSTVFRNSIVSGLPAQSTSLLTPQICHTS